MCELLIRTQDRGDGQWFAGDVVAVQPDGWPWGGKERGENAHPFWRVVEMPGVDPAAYADMLAAGKSTARARYFDASMTPQTRADAGVIG